MYSGLPVPRLFGARRTQQIASPTPDIQSAASFFRLFFNFSLIRGPVLIEGTSLHLTPAYQPLACPFNFLKAHTALQRHWNWKIPGTLQLRCNAVRNEQIQQEICLSRCSPQLVCHFIVALTDKLWHYIWLHPVQLLGSSPAAVSSPRLFLLPS